MAIYLVTDSTADLPSSLAEQYGITIVPLKVFFGAESYQDRVELTSTAFYQKLISTTTHPTTSQPSPTAFVQVYEDLAREGDTVFSIHISENLSGTVSAARMARQMLPNFNIEVIDSRSVSMGLGLIVLAAARAVKEGRGKEEILELVNDLIRKTRIYFTVDTLDYLQKGGRIGRASAWLGTLLNIKPILMIEEGMVTPHSKVRGRGRSLERLLEIVEEETGPGQCVQCAVLHGNDLDTLMKLHERAQARLKCREIIIAEVGAVVGAHAGPGVVGIAYYKIS